MRRILPCSCRAKTISIRRALRVRHKASPPFLYRMPPNKKGGKAYKKMKTGEKEEVEFIDILPMQYVARAVRVLGNRNILSYCHDNVIRICHIPRGMKGHSPDKLIEVGDIILISLRDFTSPLSRLDPATSTREQLREEQMKLEESLKRVDRGDVIAKYAPEQIRSMKKDGLYPKIFLKLEDKEGVSLDKCGQEVDEKLFLSMNKEDDLFEYEEDEEEEEETETTEIVDKREKVNHRKTREIRDQSVIQQSEKEITLDEL